MLIPCPPVLNYVCLRANFSMPSSRPSVFGSLNMGALAMFSMFIIVQVKIIIIDIYHTQKVYFVKISTFTYILQNCVGKNFRSALV